MDKKGIIPGKKDDPIMDEIHSQVSVSTSLSTAGEKAAKFSDSPHFSFQNIRLTPRIIEFIDAFEGKQFSMKISVQNIGKNPITVKIGEPNSFVFQLKKPSRRAVLLASGCSIKGTVSYTYHQGDLVNSSQIPVQVDGRLIYYPIVVKTAQPEIQVEPQKLHFKVINLGASAKSMILTIINNGGIRTKFDVDVGKNLLGLVVNPTRGTVKAKNSTNIRVEIMGLVEGEYYQELWIYTTDLPIRVPVFVEVVWPRLKIDYPKGTEEITLVDFRPTFVGTQRISSFTLKNFGAEHTLYVILAEVNGELEVLKKARDTIEGFRMFIFGSEEGYLQPFESRILCVRFCPEAEIKNKGWHTKNKSNKTKREFIIFIRINKVHSLEWKELAKIEIKPINNFIIEDKDSFDYKRSSGNTREGLFNNYSFPNTQSGEEILRLCLHGQAIEPDISFEPSSFYFGDLNLGEKYNKVLKITNNSIIAVKCKLCKVANVETVPNESWLKSENAQEFLISLTPQSPGSYRTKMKIEIFAESEVSLDSNKPLELVAVYTVNFNYTAIVTTGVSKPKVGLGITPLITDEVGLQKDSITYKGTHELPFASVLGLKQGFKPKWMGQEKDKVNKVDNAIVALPNDRPRNFYTWPKEKICRNIFTGFFRYSPPEDLTYTLSPEERSKKETHCALWIEYIALLRKLRLEKSELKNLKCHLEYDLSCKKLANLKKLKSEFDLGPHYKKLKMHQKQSEHILKNALVPLSALYLIRIKVHPKLINFGLVAVNTKAQELVTINNMNPFPISLKFTSGNSAVSVMDESTFTVQPTSTKSVYVLFQTKDLGRYFGFLNYIINCSHEFKISIFAFVTPKTLVINSEEVFLDVNKYASADPFQPRSFYLPVTNLTQAPVKYQWGFPENSIYTAEIMKGEIPPRSELLTEILFNLSPKKCIYPEVEFISENGTSNLVKFFSQSKKVAVRFLNAEVNMYDIPLNLPTKAKAVIQNSCYHDIVFELVTANPLPGITIEPKRGIIKRRSTFALEINAHIPMTLKFSIELVVIVQFHNRISVNIIGNVVLPNIRMRPSEVNLRKICVHSFDIFTLCFENVGTTPVEISMDLHSFPEFKIEKENSTLYLLPKKSSKMFIRFEPENAVRYVFYLPVILNNILGPPFNQKRETEYVSFYISEYEEMYQNRRDVLIYNSSDVKIPSVFLNTTVTGSLLKISPMNLNFQMNCSTHLTFQPQNIEILNVFTKEVTFCIRNDDLGENNSSPFDLSPVTQDSVEYRFKSLKATLKPNQILNLKATFEPKKPGSYNIEIPVFIKGYNEGLVYNYIRMSGELDPPKIHPEISEIHFPPLPLGVGCEATLMVTAENYHNPDFIKSWLCSSTEEYDLMQKCIKMEWLEEPHIKARDKNNAFQMRVKFESFFPVSLRGYILLIDSAGEYASVLVTAIADNSAVVNYAFLSTKTSNYKIIRDTPAFNKFKPDDIIRYPVKKSELKLQEKIYKTAKKTKSKSITAFTYDDGSQSSAINMNLGNNASWLPTVKGPRLVIQMTKSMTRLTELRFVNIHKNLAINSGKRESISSNSENKSSNSNETVVESQTSVSKSHAEPNSTFNLMHLESLKEENSWKYFSSTLAYVERWMFEVAMRCEQYMSIPQSFQYLRKIKTASPKKRSDGKATGEPIAKDFLDFLKEVVGNDNNLPERPNFKANDQETDKINNLRMFYADILEYLYKKNCYLPHIRPEYLLDYESYSAYTKFFNNAELFSWKSFEAMKMNSPKTAIEPTVKPDKESSLQQNSSLFFPKDSWKKLLFEDYSLMSEVELDKGGERNVEAVDLEKQQSVWGWDLVGREFEYQAEILDKSSFELRSTQAWLDIVIQIFKVFVLNTIIPRNMIPQIVAVEMTEKLTLHLASLRYVKKLEENIRLPGMMMDREVFSSNIYSPQENLLLSWLNEHLQIQQQVLWESEDKCTLKEKVINNFDKDLSDSVALLSVTASYCPYIIATHFKDIFPKPDTPNKKQHNAGKLIEAWRTLEIGVTLETSDIVRPNTVFMIMLVTHLYEVLPDLHPHFLICFSAPLNAEVSRKLPVKNEYDKRMFFKPKFFGEFEGFFNIPEPYIELKPSKVTSISVTFTARKIKKVSAVLLLSGCAVSPNFAKSLTFYLEGEPSEIKECDKFLFSAPLYKVICSEIPLKPPFPVPATYEVWYTTKQPDFKDSPNVGTLFARWSEIWNRKLSRRLFLNKSEVEIQENIQTTLSVTMACFTNERRLFWLLFRSKISDFIIQVEIKPKIIDNQIVVSAFHSESWSPSATCLCLGEPPLKMNNCPFLTILRIPMRNEDLWNALRTMFFKTLLPQEKSFWNKHFEMDIGLCLILWLLRPDEEEEVLEEFVQVLPTKVTYSLIVDSECQNVILPPSVEILDVRENGDIVVPLHISDASPEFNFKLTMVSENAKEIRSLNVYLQPLDSKSGESLVREESKPINFSCQSTKGETGKLCKETNNNSFNASVSKLRNTG